MARRVFDAKVRIQFQPSERLEQLLANLTQLLEDPAVFPALLREIVTQTLFEAYRARFQRAVPDWRRGPEKASESPQSEDDLQERLQALGRRLHNIKVRARARGGPPSDTDLDLIDRLTDQLMQMQAAGENGATYRPEGGAEEARGAGSLGTHISPGLEQVLAELTNVGAIKTEVIEGRPSIVFGDVKALDAIKAPSATEVLGKHPHPTPSDFQILWRQLEFGTGMYAKAGPHATNESKLNKQTDGSWWFGPRVGHGLHLRGAKPGNFLRDASGIAYTDYGIRFAAALAAKLTAWLEQAR